MANMAKPKGDTTVRERFEHLAGPAVGVSPGFNALDGD